jgi:pyruvate/2-oxoglutarate dehydrogenase complex dihydrolipoamide dehydrogenase (E3) component
VRRRPRGAHRGFGLEDLGIPVTKARTIQTNEFLQTAYPNIYACGDVAGPYQFTHTAAHLRPTTPQSTGCSAASSGSAPIIP